MSLPETDFNRERMWWDATAREEERDSANEGIHRTSRWREIERRLEGVKTILDSGVAQRSAV